MISPLVLVKRQAAFFYAERGTLTGAGVQGYSNLSKKRQSMADFSRSLKARRYFNMEIIVRVRKSLKES